LLPPFAKGEGNFKDLLATGALLFNRALRENVQDLKLLQILKKHPIDVHVGVIWKEVVVLTVLER
jgi:hypothetical protein